MDEKRSAAGERGLPRGEEPGGAIEFPGREGGDVEGLLDRLIPVIDLRHGVPVRGIRGERHRYQPLRIGDRRADSVELAKSFGRLVGHRELYLADLDAIEGRQPNFDVYRRLGEAGSQLWLDAGLGDVKACERIAMIRERTELAEREHHGGSIHRLIVALETLESFSALPRIVAACGKAGCAFSLDLNAGQPIARFADCPPPLEIVERVFESGVRRLIVLDLSHVGTRRGPACESLIASVRGRWPDCEIVSGGGVRDGADVRRLIKAGCDGVLVATWLYNVLQGGAAADR